jgi:hypothetical protein
LTKRAIFTFEAGCRSTTDRLSGGHNFSLLAIQPAGDEREQQSESGGVEHGQVYFRGRKSWPSSVDPDMGHYGL